MVYTDKEKQKLFAIRESKYFSAHAHVEQTSSFRLELFKINTVVKNRDETERSYPVWTFLQGSKITETFTTGETGICTCCMVQAFTRE
jgi:hypothetical protein